MGELQNACHTVGVKADTALERIKKLRASILLCIYCINLCGNIMPCSRQQHFKIEFKREVQLERRLKSNEHV